MKKLLYSSILLIAAILMLSACSYGTQKSPSVDPTTYTDPLGRVIGGMPDDLVTVCDVDELEGNDIAYVPLGDVRTSYEDPDFYNKLQEIIQAALLGSEDFRLDGADGCYLSTREIMVFGIHDSSCAPAFTCYLFSREMKPVGEIVFFERDHELTFSGAVLYSTITPLNLEVMRDDPDREYILLTNGHGEMPLNENSQTNPKYTEPFTIFGDYFHVLDWKSLAVSDNEITAEEKLLWISLKQSNSEINISYMYKMGLMQTLPMVLHQSRMHHGSRIFVPPLLMYIPSCLRRYSFLLIPPS